MKQTINFTDFCNAFREMNRDDNFSYEGKRALFEWIEEFERATNVEEDLDIIGLCCDFTEYESLEEFQQDYSADDYPTIEAIEDATTVIPINEEAFIIQQF